MNTVMEKQLGRFGFLRAGMAISILLIAAGCGNSEADMARQNILRVMQADKALSGQLKNSIPQGARPSLIASRVGRYCDDLENLDMSDCPADFRVAYHEHIRAWREAGAVIKELPDSWAGGLWMGFVNGLQGEMDGGAARMRRDVKAASEKVESTWDVVEQTGAKYGAAL